MEHSREFLSKRDSCYLLLGCHIEILAVLPDVIFQEKLNIFLCKIFLFLNVSMNVFLQM